MPTRTQVLTLLQAGVLQAGIDGSMQAAAGVRQGGEQLMPLLSFSDRLMDSMQGRISLGA